MSLAPSLVQTSGTANVGAEYQIQLANVNSITKVTYEIISGSEYISVSQNGVITAKKAGSAEVNVTFSNGINKDITQTFTIIVKN